MMFEMSRTLGLYSPHVGLVFDAILPKNRLNRPVYNIARLIITVDKNMFLELYVDKQGTQ